MPVTELSCKAVCPFFLDALDGSGKRKPYITCEGLTRGQYAISLRFLDEKSRDRWGNRFCCDHENSRLCPISRLVVAAKYREEEEKK